MEAWYRRSKLTYPAGVLPGWDPTHPAARQTRLSAVVRAGTFKEIAPQTRQATLGTTPPTFSNHSHLGPVGVFNGSTSINAVTVAGLSTANDTVATVAAIFTITAFTSTWCPIANSGSSAGYAINIATTPGVQMVLPGTVVTSVVFGTIAVNTPYFLAVSNVTGLQNYVLCNLSSGQIQTATTASAYTSAALNGTADIGCWSQNSQAFDGDIAAVMWSNTFLGLGSLKMWAADPWAFWYPQPEENWVASTGLPPGRQIFYIPQDDPNAGRSIQLRGFEKAGAQLLLTGQDRFNPGKQIYDRQPDPQDSFAQWRSFAGWYNQNLIGKDQLPTGKQTYDLPLAQVPDTFSRWRTWTGSYNLNLIGKDKLPAGQQSWELPASQVYDPFARWRSWTGSYNQNLIGKDVLPIRNPQTYTFPLDWRTEQPQQNLLNTVLVPPSTALPPGVQRWELPVQILDSFAQWRSWAGSYNQNLIGQDQMIPGKQTNYLPSGPTWQPESPQANILASLLTVPVPQIPPGRQSYDLPPPPNETFAQWRTWTGSYNPNLIAQDAFPPGAQWDERPDGVLWRPDSPPANLLLTLRSTVPQLPPGKQYFDRPRFFFLM